MHRARTRIAIGCVALVTLSSIAVGAQPSPPVPLAPKVHDAVIASDGKITPQVRGVYLDWAQTRVLDELASKRREVAQSILDDVHRDPVLRDAMFACVYPPDADILQNYARLSKALGPAFMKKYRSLVIGVAVAQRSSPVPSADENDFYPRGASTEPSDKDDNGAEPTDAVATGAAEFIKAQNTTALDVFKDPGKRQQLIDFLRDHQHVDQNQLDALKVDKPMGRALKRAMIILGQRPAAREAKPDEVTWLKYLATTYESNADTPKKKRGKGEMDWPLFPMDKAPWPLLMPLARPMPLGEARFIWEKFNGQHGPDRYHSYGPYRLWPKQILYELQPSDLHWDSWQDRCIHGGVCVVMCTITIDLHSALCVPSVHAGQPHHANLMTYHATSDGWEATVDQPFAGGPDVTHAAWLFHDEPLAARMSRKDVGAEYHLGLAQAMNVGVRQWIDTRMAVSIYRALPEPEQKTLGVKLLTQATAENPFNPATWYLLASRYASSGDTKAGDALLASARNHVGNEDVKLKKSPPPVQYWRTLAEYVEKELSPAPATAK